MFKRMIVYLYYYEKGEKRRNCGYVKVTVHQEECRMEMNLIGIPELEGEIRLHLCGLVDGKIVMTRLDCGQVQNGDACLRCQCDREAIAGNLAFEDLKWILVEGEEQFERTACGCFGKEEIDFDKIKKKEDLVQEHVEVNEPKEEKKEEKMEPNPVISWQEQIFHMFPKVELNLEGETTVGIKIRPQDMIFFPGEYWRIATNKFVLNTYYSYRYLLFFRGMGERKGKYFLGLPGEDVEQRARIATQFGFPDFLAIGNGHDNNLPKKGLWCRETC